MEYEVIKYDSKKKDVRESETGKGRRLDFSLKALDHLEFEMPAVCH